MLFGIAALLLAAAALVFVILQSRHSPILLPAGSSAVPASSSASAAPATPGTSAAPLPTSAVPPPTTSAALSPEIGAPQENARLVEKGSREKRKPATSAEGGPASAPGIVAEEHSPESLPRETKDDLVYDNVYRTRRGMKFQISPDQARLYVDGKFIGIADDWDDHGGGKVFPFTAPGSHHVRAVLPGFQDLNLQIMVTPSARDEESASDEMRKTGKASYPKIPKVDYATTGAVAFVSAAGDGEVSVDGKPAGRVSEFTAAHPLKLAGPSMHDITVTEGGRTSRTVRVLVASTAGKELASIKVKL